MKIFNPFSRTEVCWRICSRRLLKALFQNEKVLMKTNFSSLSSCCKHFSISIYSFYLSFALTSCRLSLYKIKLNRIFPRYVNRNLAFMYSQFKRDVTKLCCIRKPRHTTLWQSEDSNQHCALGSSLIHPLTSRKGISQVTGCSSIILLFDWEVFCYSCEVI